MKGETLSHEYVSSKLSYDVDTGELKWNEVKGRFHSGSVAGSETSGGYVLIQMRGEKIGAHRLAWFIVHGVWPNEIDHINGVTNDNRLVNLRNVTHAENGRNQRRQKNNSTGVNGVGYIEMSETWRARIAGIDGVEVNLGSYKTLFDAVCARKSAEVNLGYHENHGS